MENFMASFNVVFPIFVMMIIGYFLKQIKFIDEATVKKNNALVFKLFLPVMLFKNVYESDISSVFDRKLILFATISTLIIIASLFIIVPLFVKDNQKRGVIIQGMFRSNFVIFGVPVTEALCGSEVAGSAAVLVAIIVPLFNTFAVVSLSVFNNRKTDFGSVITNIIKNPLIISSAVGLAFLFAGIKIPDVIYSSASSLSKVTTPFALMMLGASINLKRVESNLSALMSTLLVKLIIIPVVFIGAGIFVFGFKGADLAILLALFATPTAVSSYTMAQQMGGDDELAGLLVMFGTCFCLITMFVYIYVIKSFGLL